MPAPHYTQIQFDSKSTQELFLAQGIRDAMSLPMWSDIVGTGTMLITF
jgi:hypothetical protein